MKTELIIKLVTFLIGMLKPEYLKKLVDFLLDLAEEAVLNSETTVDDKIILPLCELIRKAFDIPD